MALLGKISAVITANTTDFTRNIGNVKSELEALRRRADGYRLNLDTAALDKTLTKLQLFRRTMQEAFGKGIDTGPLQDLYRAYEDLGKPLTKVKGQIESLSNSTQAYLYPALERAQKGFQNLYKEIQVGSTTFDAQRGRIDALARSIERLRASTAVVTEFSRATERLSTEGAGGTFVQPRALEELKRAAELRKEAAKLPASSREDPFFQKMVLEAAVAAERIEALAARVERAKQRAALAESVISRANARGAAPPAAALAAAAAAASDQMRSQAALDRETELLRGRNDQMSGASTLAAVSQMRQPPAQSREAAVAASVTKAIEALRAANPAGAFEPLVQNLIDSAEAASRAADDTKRLATALNDLEAKAAAGTRLGSAQQAIDNITDNARSRVDALRTRADRRREATDEARAAGVPREDITAARRRDFLANDIGGRVGGLQQTISGLSNSLRGDLQQRLDAARRSLRELVNTSAAPAQAEIERLRRSVQGLEQDAASAARQQRLLDDFSSGTAINLQPRAVRDYINDFQLLLNLAGNLNEEMGTRFSASLQRSRERVGRLAEQLASVRSGPATPETARQAEQILANIRRESRALAAELSSLDPARFSTRQLDRMLSANRRLRGDVAGMRGAAMSGQLALQQLTFAVDDFFSSTGNFEYKLRAISNNISQFGFILGGTKGLVAAVAATIATQLLIQFGGLGRASKESEGALKFMNEELAKSRNLAEQTTKSFEEMTKALVASSRVGPRGEIEQRIRDLRDQQKKAREADVISRSPAVAAAAGKRAAIEDELSNARGSDRIRLARELEAARRAEQDARRDAVAPRSNAAALSAARDAIENARQAELATLDARSGLLFVGADVTRASRRKSLQTEVVSTPANASDAASQIRSRIEELQKTQAGTDFAIKFLSDLPEFITGGFSRQTPVGIDVNNYRDTERAIEALDTELARLEEVIRAGADDVAAGFAEQLESSKQEIASAFQELASIGLDADQRANVEKQFASPASQLSDAVTRIKEALDKDPAANIDALKKQASDAAAALESLYKKADALAGSVALGSVVPTSRKLASASEIAGSVGGPTMAGTAAAIYAERLRVAERERDRAQVRGDAPGMAAADGRIDNIRKLADSAVDAAIAVAEFQRAAERAALDLSQSLVSEAASDFDRMRRRANKLASDPDLAGSAAAARDAAEKRMREQEDSDRRLRAEIERERLKFEQEMRGGGGGRVAELAKAVREGRAAQANKELSTAEQLAGKQRADEAQAQLRREFADRTRPFRDEADARDAERQKELERIRLLNERTVGDLNITRTGIGDNVKMATGIDARAVEEAVALAASIEELRRKMEEASAAGEEIPQSLKDTLASLTDSANEQRGDLVSRAKWKAMDSRGGLDAQSSAAKSELERSGVFASDVQGKLVELEFAKKSLELKRDAAISENRADEAAALQRFIDSFDDVAEELNKASIAVAAFQRAANAAALDLQKRVESESQGAAESARRRANEVEAVFGANSPQAREARAEQKRREDAARASEDERARAEEAIANERVKFEQEMANGQNPAAKARADKIAELERIADDKDREAAEREAARAEANRLRMEQEREFANRPEVQRERQRADEADRDRARVDSVARGRELMKTDLQRAREELAAKAGDIGNAADQMRKDGAGRAQVDAAVRTAATNLARQQAPLFAQFADEVMNARLSGPSRAALTAADAQTTDGARELNRLLRGDDASKDVNLTELRKQSQLLEAIEDAIRNSTGVVVDL